MRFTTRAVYTALAAHLASLAALVLFEETRGRDLSARLATAGGPDSSAAQAMVGPVTVFAVLIMLTAGTLAAAAIAYLAWLVRARRNKGQAASAVPVLFGWLIPGVNLIAPLLLVDGVWRKARPPSDRRARWLLLLGAWWVSWLAAVVAVARRIADDTAGSLTGIGPGELLVAALAALLCAGTVKEIERAQSVVTRARALPGSLSHA